MKYKAMKMTVKKAVAIAAVLSMTLSAGTVMASEGYYWEDEAGNVWYYDGSEDSFVGTPNDYYIDPDTGELMEGNDAGWDINKGDAPTDFGYYYWTDANDNVWYHNGDVDEFIGTSNDYYIDPDTGELMEANDAWDSDESDPAEDEEDDARYHAYLDFAIPEDMKLIEYTSNLQGYETQIFMNQDETVMTVIHRSSNGALDELDMTYPEYMTNIWGCIEGSFDMSDTTLDSYPAYHISYTTMMNEGEKQVEAVYLETDYDYLSFVTITNADVIADQADYVQDMMKSLTLKDVNDDNAELITTELFSVEIPEIWQGIYTTEVLVEENNGYSISFLADGDMILSIEARPNVDIFEADSNWQTELGYVYDPFEDTTYTLILTITQPAPDAGENFQTMYNSMYGFQIVR